MNSHGKPGSVRWARGTTALGCALAGLLGSTWLSGCSGDEGGKEAVDAGVDAASVGDGGEVLCNEVLSCTSQVLDSDDACPVAPPTPSSACDIDVSAFCYYCTGPSETWPEATSRRMFSCFDQSWLDGVTECQ